MSRDRDLVDILIADWARERPDLDASAMAVVLDLLATLRRQGAPYELTPTELRRSVLISSGAMTAAVNRLKENAYVTVSESAADRRSRIIQLTEEGRELIDRAIAVRFDEARDAIKDLSHADTEALTPVLRKLLLALDENKAG